MIGLLIPLTVLAFVAVLIALGVFVVLRVRSGEPLVLSFRTILVAYFYLMTIASLLLFTIGLSVGIKAVFSDVFGREFSYWMPPAVRALRPSPPGAIKPSPATQQEPAPEEERERNRRQVERQYQDDLIQGGTLTIVGALLWGLHLFGRRYVETPEETSQAFFSKAYTTILLAIFGIVGVVSLPMGIYEALRYFLLQPDEFMARQPPGTTLATAVVFVPVWVFYLFRVLRQSQQETFVP